MTTAGKDLNNKNPGSDIDSWCGKCKMILAHTIEAMDGNKPARVHCNTCKAQHAYKPNPPRTPSSSPAKPRAKRQNTLLKEAESRPMVAYSTKSTYAQGDVLDHPMFGRGVTTAVKDRTKILVLFDDGPKTLIHGS